MNQGIIIANLHLNATSSSKITIENINIKIGDNISHHKLAVDAPVYRATITHITNVSAKSSKQKLQLEKDRFENQAGTTASDYMIYLNSLTASSIKIFPNDLKTTKDILSILDVQKQILKEVKTGTAEHVEHVKNLHETAAIVDDLRLSNVLNKV
jgi:hypothetical protein